MLHFSIDSRFAVALLSISAFGAANGQLSPSSCRPTAPTAPEQTTLSNVKTALISVPNEPFELVYATKQHDIAFVTLDHDFANSTLGVLNTSTFPPSLAHQIPLPPAYINYEGASGLTLTNGGRHLFVSAGEGAVVADAALAAAGCSNAVVGTLNGTTRTQKPGNASIQTTVTGNKTYAFVSQEYGASPGTSPGNVDVFELHTSCNGSVSGTPIGHLNLGYEVVGTVLSPNGRTLYATSESYNANSTLPGFISVIDVETLIANPSNSQAILSNVTAGCGPVRAIVSSDGEVLWVTARESDLLLAFNATKLVSSPDEALIVSVQVGAAPVGLTFVSNETRILTADSNRFNSTNATSGLSVVDVHAALAGSNSSVLGRVPTGLFPREFALSPNGSTVLVADYDSKQIQAVDVSSLP